MILSTPAQVEFERFDPKMLNDFTMPLFKFKINGCTKYVHSEITEFYLETDNIIHYVNIDTHRTDTDEKYEKYKNEWTKFKTENPQSDLLQFSYFSDDVQHVNMTSNNCYLPANLQTATEYMKNVNKQLSKTGIQIEINELQNISSVDLWIYEEQNPAEMLEQNYLLLCLNIGNKCVSSIVLAPELENHNSIEIISATRDELQGRGYNTVLRAISIIIAPLIWSTATHVLSKAVNPLSAWLMITKFGAESDLTDMDEITDYIASVGSMSSIVPLDVAHNRMAETVVNRFLLTHRT